MILVQTPTATAIAPTKYLRRYNASDSNGGKVHTCEKL